MKRQMFVLILILVFSMSPFLGMDQMVEANDGADEDVLSSAKLINLVERLEDEGQFENDRSSHALKIHLTAVNRFEQREATEKVVKHLQGFQLLLDHQQADGLLSEQAYDTLKGETDALLKKWDSLVIVNDGEAQAVVVISEDSDEQINRVADTLVEYVEKATGVELVTQTMEQLTEMGPSSSQIVNIYIGFSRSEDEVEHQEWLKDMRDDGFIIDSREDTITILGQTGLGTEYGVYEFLERYVDVRWLMPGPDGEDVPQRETLSISRQLVKDEPAYWSRMMYPLQYENAGGNYPTRHEWGVFNRLREQNPGWEHNVWRFFPPAVYEETHPEFYPRKDGVPQIPSTASRWQPCYSNEDTIQVAADWVIDYFNQNPDEPAISLAVNDSGNYCEEQPDHPNYTNERNSIGLTDMSDIYYSWVNEVVEKVLEVHPDKWFGVLAYQQVYDPPSFPLHERVVPYLTKDRMAWSDSEVRAKDQAVVDGWNEKAAQIGFYDYIYGNPYTLPRVYNHLMADVLKYGKDNNTVAFFGELGPNWGEGPKPWILTKLLWDPEQDVDHLLNEWYERAVGPEAAPYIKAYYDHWEYFWENRIQQTDWFQSRKNIVYFNFNSYTYLSAVTDEEIAQSREWLETAVDKAGTEKQKARAQLLLRAFEYFEASALSYPNPVSAVTDTASALDLLDESINYQMRTNYAQKRLDLMEEFASDPVLAHPRGVKEVWSGFNPDAFWRLVDFITENEAAGGPVRQQVEEYAGSGQSEATYAQLLLQAVDGEPVNLNPSFEESGDPNNEKVTAKHWEANITNYGTFEQKEEMPYSGDASIYLHDFYYGDINQTVDAEPGLAITRLKYYVTPETETVGDIWLELNLLDQNGAELATIKSDQQAFSSSLGRWEAIQIMDKIPARVDGVPVKKVRMAAIINGFHEGGTMYLDDFELYQVHDPNIMPPLKSAEAENGLLRVTFHKMPETAPTVDDFTVWQRTGAEPVMVTPEMSWDEQTMTATLELPEVPRQPWEQSVRYEVSYGNIDNMTTNAVEIPALEGYTQILKNPSFEDWTGNFPDNWIYLGESFKRSDTVKRSGQSSVTADGIYQGEIEADGGGPIQTIDSLTPGHYHGVFHFLTSSQAEGTITYMLRLKDENGVNISPLIKSTPVETKMSNGYWKTVSFEFDIEPEYGGRKVSSGQVFVIVNDLTRDEDNAIFIDDVSLIRQLPFMKSTEVDGNHLRVEFNKTLDHAPTAADFEVKQLSGEEPVQVTPEVYWDPSTMTATLELPEVPRQPWKQSVRYEVSYGNVDKMTTNAVEIPALEGYTQVLTNSSFEDWTGNFPDDWIFLAEAFTRSNEMGYSGQSSLVANGLSPQEIAASGSGPRQSITELEPGKYYGVYRFFTESQTDGTLHFLIQLKDQEGNIIYPTIKSERVETRTSHGRWKTVVKEFNIEAVHNDKEVAGANLFVLLNDLERGNMIYLDDIEFIRVGD